MTDFETWATEPTPESQVPIEGQQLQRVVFGEGGYDIDEQRYFVDELSEANLITSLVKGSDPRKHKVVLDIDLPAQLIPSTTEGHFHLYIDHEMDQDTYMNLLDAMCAAGLIEDGYAQAAHRREFTAVRLPWIKKEPRQLGPVLPQCVGCNLTPEELPEYVTLADTEGWPNAVTAVIREEGTYNPKNGHFYCTSCYIKAGQPEGVAQ